MAFLKSSRITGITARDVAVRGFRQTNNINLGTRAYNKHEVLLADNYSIKGDVNVSDNLILSKLSDDGDDITITGDTTTRTILVQVQLRAQLSPKLQMPHSLE